MSRILEEELERKIVSKLVHDLLGDGFSLSVSLERGYDHETMLTASRDLKKITEEIFSGDECHVFVHLKNRQPVIDGIVNSHGWVFLVLGNGEDIISDYTTNLDGALKRTNEFAERYRD